MKKIITTVVVAALGFASFGACQYTATVKETAWIYKWSFKGKTTTGEQAKTVKAAPASLCGYAGEANPVTCAVRVPSSLKIEGYTAICMPGCGTDSFEQFAEVNEVFWQKKPFKASLAGGVTSDVVHIIGRNKKQVELAGQANFDKFVEGTIKEGSYSFTYAGFGKYDLKNSRIKAVKGTFAGYLTQPHAVSISLCTSAGYWDCETLGLDCEGTSIATGKFKVKYQKNASKKFLAGKFPAIPAWATPLN